MFIPAILFFAIAFFLGFLCREAMDKWFPPTN